MTKKEAFLSTAVTVAIMLVAAGTAASAETRIEKSLKLEPGGRLVLEVDGGGVDVKGGPGAGAKILVTSKQDDLQDKYDFSFTEEPGLVRVTAKKKGGWTSSWFGGWTSDPAPQFEIQVPTKTGLDLRTGGGHIEVSTIEGEAILKTSGGHIGLKNIVGDARVETSGGHIEAESVTGTLEAKTSGGHLKLAGVKGDLKARTSGGHIDIKDAGGRVDAETSGGHIEASFAEGNARGGRLDTSGGSIHVKVDSRVALSFDASTSGGTVKSSLPLTKTDSKADSETRSSLRGTLGAGGERLVLRTSAGSITIDGLYPSL